MSRAQWAVSLLLAYYLVAAAVTSIPNPANLPATTENPLPSNPSAGPVRHGLDALLRAFVPLPARLFALTAPVRPLVQPFINTGIGGEQQWAMFSNPELANQYIRVDSFAVDDRSGRRRGFRELLLPAHHEDRVRLWHLYRDKSVLALLGLYTRRLRGIAAGDDPTPALISVEPITRYARKRLSPLLSDGERIMRTELWLGIVPIPPPGVLDDPSIVRTRLDQMRPYHDRAIEIPIPAGPGRRIGSVLQDGDVEWALLFVDPLDRDAIGRPWP